MRTFIGVKLLSSKLAQPTVKPFEIYDNRLSGFTLRVQPTGVRSYYARFGRNRRFALGKVGTLRPDEARDRCQRCSAMWPTAGTRCMASTAKARR
jgi:Arm DNA-binding domain